MIKVVDKQDDANCITHSGTMHADEVFATAFLEMYLGDVFVYRTNSVDLDSCRSDQLVYDIGRGVFDHHQQDRLIRDNGIPYCAFGLIFKEFGKKFLKVRGYNNVDKMFNLIDIDLVEAIDADDNGIFPRIEASYKVKTLSSIIKLFNPSYKSLEEEDEQFVKAVNLARMILEEEIIYINGKVLAEEKINLKLDELGDNDKYLILDEFLPYEEFLITNKKADNILFVAFPSNRGGYAIKTVPKSIDDKTSKVLFPEAWAGLSNQELQEVSGIDGLRFCHISRFIVNCKDLESVYKVLNEVCK